METNETAAEAALRSLACWLGVGGYNAETVDAAVYEAKIREGVEMMVRTASGVARQELLNTPELHSFAEGVTLEALHQRERWSSEHDAGKAPADWFWLVGYLAGKALHAQTSGNTDKARHHTISAAAALANWHAAVTGAHVAMRPGIDPAAHGVAALG